MQDQVADPIGLDGAAEETSIGKDPALALKLLQGSRPHAIGQWRQLLALQLTLKSEKVLAQRCAITGPNRAFFGGIRQRGDIQHIIPLPAGILCVNRSA